MSNRSLIKYRILCTTTSTQESAWLESTEDPLDYCPVNDTHTVDTESVTIIDQLAAESLTLSREDNRIVVAPSLYPVYFQPYFTSVGDNFENGTRGDGTEMHAMMGNTSPEMLITDIQFIEPVQMIGGHLIANSTNMQDHVSFEIVAPPTPVTINANTQGDIILSPIPGAGNIIIPYGNIGTHDLNATTSMNANLVGSIFVSQSVPVPALKKDGISPDGYWDWDDFTGAITACPLKDGYYNLYDSPITLNRYVNQWHPFSGMGQTHVHKFFINQKGGTLPGQYIHRCTTTRSSMHDDSDTAVHYSWAFYMARRTTV